MLLLVKPGMKQSSMIDNFEIIRELLEFRSSDDFYFIQVLQRKKDHKDIKVNGTNNNSRLIKPYYVGSLEYFDFIKPEIIELCKIFGARAGINLNRRSYKKMQLHCLSKITKQIIDGTHNKVHKAYPSVVGNFNQDTDKKWILDIDEPTYNLGKLGSYLKDQQPWGRKILSVIPSKSGIHVISSPFDTRGFKNTYPDIEIHKNNPTNLYIP